MHCHMTEDAFLGNSHAHTGPLIAYAYLRAHNLLMVCVTKKTLRCHLLTAQRVGIWG